MNTVTITLPYPVSANNFKTSVGGHMVKSAAARAYTLEAQQLAMKARLKPMDGRLSVRIDVYQVGRQWMDLGNVEKLPVDSMKGWLFHDDRQIDRLLIVRHRCDERPRVVLSVSRITGNEDG